MACLHMPVDRVPAAVELAVGEPFVERRIVVEEGLDGRFIPIDALCAASIQKAFGSLCAAA
jgi:hypothetical protein